MGDWKVYIPAVGILYDFGGKHHDFISLIMHMVQEYLDIVVFKNEKIYIL